VLKIAEECNEAVGRAEALETDSLNHDVLQPDHKVRTTVKTCIRMY
jgi:hypothetical protein